MRRLFAPILVFIFASLCPGQVETSQTRDKIGSAYPLESIKGWLSPRKDESRSFEIFLDETVTRSGGRSVSLRFKGDYGPPNNTFLMQTIRADNYLGKRVRFSAFAKAENVESAGFSLRVEGDGMTVLNQDMMERRPITGTRDWQRYDIVMDVPPHSKQLVFLIRLKGSGQIWVDDLKFEEVGQEIPVTTTSSPSEIEARSNRVVESYRSANPKAYRRQLKGFDERNTSAALEPVNLDFEDQQPAP